MKIAHLSDTHLGFRAFSKLTPSGINQREADVFLTFKAVLASILEREPDIVVHAGDLFHVCRPSNNTIVETFREIEAFQKSRGFKPFVLVGGNHDTPKTAELGNIQRLIATIPGVLFAPTRAKVFDLPALDLEVLCVPSNSLLTREEVIYRPSGERKFSILSVHGMASEALPKALDATHADYSVDDLHPELFTYTALGDYHVFTPYSANCCFSGSTDFTTTNIWEETGMPKGWVFFDTELGELEHVPIQTRLVADLEPIDYSAFDPETLKATLALSISRSVEDSFSEPIVRQRIINFPPTERKNLPTALIREIASKCLNYQIKTSPPLRDKGTGEISAVVAAAPLEIVWADHVAALELPRGIDREALSNAGLDLLREAQELAV